MSRRKAAWRVCAVCTLTLAAWSIIPFVASAAIRGTIFSTATGPQTLKVRMINPFHEGIAVKPPKITYLNWSKGEKHSIVGLQWQSWGGAQAMAHGQNKHGDPVDVTLSAQQRCGLPQVRFYTQMTVNRAIYKLQCEVRVISGRDIGGVAEDVSAFMQHYVVDKQYTIDMPPKGASLMGGLWRHVGGATTQGRGVTDAWWPFPDFRWAAALMKQSKLGYCRQAGAIVYLKVRLITFGNGIEAGSIPFRRAAPILRRQIGKARPRHSVQYNYSKWCNRNRYPEDQWVGWR